MKKLVSLAKKEGFLLHPNFPQISEDEFKEFLNYAKENLRDKFILTKEDYEAFLKLKSKALGGKSIEKKFKEETQKEYKKEKEEEIKEEKTEKEKLEKEKNIEAEEKKKEVKGKRRKATKLLDFTVKKEEKKEEPKKEEKPKEVIVEKTRKEIIISRDIEAGIKIEKAPNPRRGKKEVKDFINMLLDRYNRIKDIFRGRLNFVSIGHLSGERKVEVVGLVYEIRKMRTSYKITLEDPTGMIDVIVKDTSEAFKMMDYIVEDIVIGVRGSKSGGVIFADEIIFPDIPHIEKTRTKEEVWAAFTSDFHFGSKMHIKKEVEMFIKFLRGELGNGSLREVAAKTKYIIINGDIVDGIGIYPGQENELVATDIEEQYKLAGEILSKIPDDKIIIFIPGNHDVAAGLSEPQPPFDEEFQKFMREYLGDRFFALPNPVWFRIHHFKESKGPLILAYHGYSMDRIIDRIPVFRQEGYQNSWKILKFMLQVRHLAPFHGATLQIPDKKDHLLIDMIPDIFVASHIHYLSVGEYRGVQLLVTSCWQAATPFQIKLGHNPQPGYVPLINLKDRRVKVLDFSGG